MFMHFIFNSFYLSYLLTAGENFKLIAKLAVS